MKIAIASGKGGTGKTFLTTQLFYALQEEGVSVALADCDAEVPNALAFLGGELTPQQKNDVMQYRPVIKADLCTFCGACVEYCAFRAIFYLPEQKQIRLMEDFCHGCGACAVACKHRAIEDTYVTVGEVLNYSFREQVPVVEARLKVGCSTAVPVIKGALRAVEKLEAEYVLMDAPPGTSCPFVQTVSGADYVVLVTEPTPFGLSDLRQAVETLRTMNKPCGVVVNRAGVGDRGVYDYLQAEGIPLLGEIPFDREIARCYSEGRMAVVEMPPLKETFLNLFKSIQHHGDSHHQR